MMSDTYVCRLPEITIAGRTYVEGEVLPRPVGDFEPGRPQNHWCRGHDGPLVACGTCGALFAHERGLAAHAALAHGGGPARREPGLPGGPSAEAYSDADAAWRGAVAVLKDAREAHRDARRALSGYRATHKASTDPHFAHEVAQREAVVEEMAAAERVAERAEVAAAERRSIAYAAALDAPTARNTDREG
jgi:hypothetical protein